MIKHVFKWVVGTILILTVIYAGYQYFRPKSVGTNVETGSSMADYDQVSSLESEQNTAESQPPIQTILTNLEIPWEITFLPNSDLLITQRIGSLLHITENGTQTIPVSGVEHIGEGGLLGLALHPNFNENNYLYLYLTSESENGLINRVERYVFSPQNHTLSQKTTILDNIPGARYHDGGRIAFGPDGLLYITTGDAGKTDLSQDTSSLAGKILKITDDGKVPENNPFSNEVFSYGHRNPQGIDWDQQGRLWSSEHGPSVVTTGFDEVNLITPGSNYGWPEITGDETKEGMLAPTIQSGSEETWAPADLAVYKNLIFFSGLRGEGLYSAIIDGDKLINIKKHFDGEYGRIRAVVVDPTQQWLYFTTSNTDGRGSATEADDKVVRVNLQLLESLSLTK